MIQIDKKEDSIWVRLYDDMEDSEEIIKIFKDRKEELKQLLDKYRAENEAYTYCDFLDLLEEKGILIDRVEVRDNIYF